MTVYSVLDVTPHSQDWTADYVPVSNERVAAHGGRYIARTTRHEQLEGDDRPAAMRIIIEWPSRQAALDFMADPVYAPRLEARTQGSASHHYLIDGTDDLA